MGEKTMHVRQHHHYPVFPPPCHRCGEIIEVGQKYYPHRIGSGTNPYCSKCEEEMYY